MLNALNLWDHSVFSYFYYVFPHSPILTAFFSFLSGIEGWGLIWFLIIIALIVWEEIKSRRELLMLIIAVGLSTLFADYIIKGLIHRIRPFGPSSVMVLFHASSYSFPSGHSTMAFAAATVLAIRHKRFAIFYYLLAFLIAFSRIYLGKHYPIDVLGGMVLGVTIGCVSVLFTNWFIYILRKYNIVALPLP